jgi:flagellar motor component MotA
MIQQFVPLFFDIAEDFRTRALRSLENKLKEMEEDFHVNNVNTYE